MNNEINSVGKTPMSGYQWPVGIAYVAIPSDVERDVYIRECYLNHYVSLWTEDGSFFNRISCDIDLFNWIEFPKTYKEYGTALCYVTEPTHQQPIVIARLPKVSELGDLRENQFRFRRRLGNKVVEISGSPQNNSLNLIVNSGEESGSINLILHSDNDDGKLNLSIAGDIVVETVGEVDFLQKKRFYAKTSGEVEKEGEHASYEQVEGANKFEGKRFIINEGDEPFILGNKAVSFFENLIDQIAAITAVSPLGPLPITNAPQILALKADLKSILSQEGFLKQ